MNSKYQGGVESEEIRNGQQLSAAANYKFKAKLRTKLISPQGRLEAQIVHERISLMQTPILQDIVDLPFMPKWHDAHQGAIGSLD